MEEPAHLNITPEMIAAGIDELYQSDVIYEAGHGDPGNAVAAIYAAMLAAATPPQPAPIP